MVHREPYIKRRAITVEDNTTVHTGSALQYQVVALMSSLGLYYLGELHNCAKLQGGFGL